MTDAVAKKMSEASATEGMNPPKKGERFRCQGCGIQIEVTADCRCQAGEHVHFQCCGQDMAKV